MNESKLNANDEYLLRWTADALEMPPESLLQKALLLGMAKAVKKSGKLGREDDFCLDGLN
jgi:hypothetical protein